MNERLSRLLDRPSAIARMTGCRVPSVIKWRESGIPAGRAPFIERGKLGEYTCEEMCPSVRWVRVADPSWPHPAGRPCIDVAGASSDSSAAAGGTEARQEAA